MSTPIESNTEELQEVLQQVYNLPNRSGGSNSYDLTIQIDQFDAHDIGGLTMQEVINYNPTEVINTIAKLENYEIVNVVMFGEHCISSATAFATFPAVEVTCSGNHLRCVFNAINYYASVDREDSGMYNIVLEFYYLTGELTGVRVYQIGSTKRT